MYIDNNAVTFTNDERLESEEVYNIVNAATERKSRGNNRDLRLGQCLYSVLYETHPELAIKVFKTKADPFYDDDNITRFLTSIRKQP